MKTLQFILFVITFVMTSKSLAQEKGYASVAPDHTLIELGCSIAKALKDPKADDRCNRIMGTKEDISPQKNKNLNTFDLVKNKHMNL